MPGKVEAPVGSVYTGDSLGNRQVLVPLPDTPENRFFHLKLLERIREGPREEYPIGIPSAVAIIDQLAEWGEIRAIPDLEMVAAGEIADGNIRIGTRTFGTCPVDMTGTGFLISASSSSRF
jgi:hypothetical protein